MRLLARIAAFLLVGALLVGVAGLVFASVAAVLAVVGPLAGLGYLASQLRAARALWRSEGRLPIADGVRVVGAGRTRVLAGAHVLAGAGGFLVGVVPAAYVLGSLGTALLALVAGVLSASAGAAVSERALASARGVDVLPPDR